MSGQANIIEVKGLSKTFGKTVAVNQVSFAVRHGELFGFLGPNGAGKTTTVRMLTGVLEPTEGTATIQGHDIRSEALLSRAHLAVVPEEANVYLDLSLWQNIMLMAELHGMGRKQRTHNALELLESLGLADRKHQKARTLSKGLRQRLMLCAALVTEPEILFLDEPTSGLDVQSARLIRRIVQELNTKGLTVFLTTHNMEEAEKMCSRLAIINNGQISAIDSPRRLHSAMRCRQFVEVSFLSEPPPMSELQSLSGVSSLDSAGNTIRLYTEKPGRTAAEIALFAKSKPVEIEHLCTRKPSLEDVFLYFTGQNKKEPAQ
ncbi:MAG TPA: ATP-binding cassette domain-containing protein [Planctomycetes bacterium]|nr:ATP-binding cassette domain-containing protein [Planctomycetota bacterium]